MSGVENGPDNVLTVEFVKVILGLLIMFLSIQWLVSNRKRPRTHDLIPYDSVVESRRTGCQRPGKIPFAEKSLRTGQHAYYFFLSQPDSI